MIEILRNSYLSNTLLETNTLLYTAEHKSGIDQLPEELGVFKIRFAVGKVDNMNIPGLRT
jgi:hypothetical protein